MIDCDVVSFYPSLSICNFLAPKHYDVDTWVDSYGRMKKDRLKYDKGTVENLLLKLALNATYGNSGNKYSPIHDNAYTVSTCINGQLTLTMLTEQWLRIPGLKIISKNTDGANAAVPREHIRWFKQINDDFENMTGLELEYAYYHTMFHRDCNNFAIILSDEEGNRLENEK